MKIWLPSVISLALLGCGESGKPVTFQLAKGMIAVASVTRYGASAQNTARVTLQDASGRGAIDIFDGKGGPDPKVYSLSDGRILVEYCGGVETNTKNYLYNIGDNLDNNNIYIIVATSEMYVGGKMFCRKVGLS